MNNKTTHQIIINLFFVFIGLLFSCTSKKENIMFKVSKDFVNDTAFFNNSIEENYIIQTQDYISVKLYSNGGEIILDPNNWLSSSISGSGQQQQIDKPKYLVEKTGAVQLPLIGRVMIAGHTLKQADSILSKSYSHYYVEPFIITSLENRRVIIIGPIGGQVIPLENENTNLIEVIALYGGMDKESKAHNIRLIRGDLKEPHVQLINLKTIEGMKQAQLQVMPNDIVYIEQVRKPFIESARDWASIIGIITATIAMFVLIDSLRN